MEKIVQFIQLLKDKSLKIRHFYFLLLYILVNWNEILNAKIQLKKHHFVPNILLIIDKPLIRGDRNILH